MMLLFDASPMMAKLVNISVLCCWCFHLQEYQLQMMYDDTICHSHTLQTQASQDFNIPHLQPGRHSMLQGEHAYHTWDIHYSHENGFAAWLHSDQFVPSMLKVWINSDLSLKSIPADTTHRFKALLAPTLKTWHKASSRLLMESRLQRRYHHLSVLLWNLQ